MWSGSRRKFIFSVLSSGLLWSYYQNNIFALGKKNSHFNPHLVAAEYWPPAISCNFLDVFDDNLCCMVDNSGRLATADVLSAANGSHIYPVLGEINNLGDRVVFFRTIESQALVVSTIQVDKNITGHGKHSRQPEQSTSQDRQFICYLVSLSDPHSPFVVSNTLLTDYLQINSFAVSSIKNRPVLGIAGVDWHGDNRITFFGLKRKNKLETISSIKLKRSVNKILFNNNTLLAFYDTAEAGIFSLNRLNNPEFLKSVSLPEHLGVITSYANLCLWSKKEQSLNKLTLSNLETFPQALSQTAVPGLSFIDALSMNDKYVFALGSDEETGLVVPFSIAKNYSLQQQKAIKLVDIQENSTRFNNEDTIASASIVLAKDAVFISSGWSGVEVITNSHKNDWKAISCYGLQKLPIAGMATWSNYLLLADTDLKLYDLEQSKHPKLLITIKPTNSIKAMVCAGSYVLCLDKVNLSLRKIEKPGNIIVELPMKATTLTYDKVDHKAYLIQTSDLQKKKIEYSKLIKSEDSQNKKGKQIESSNLIDASENKDSEEKAQPSKLIQLEIYNNSIKTSKTFSILEGAHCSSANEGYVLVGNLDSLAIYKPDQEVELICQREFKDLAWRDIILYKGNIFATAIDKNVTGYFLTMSFDGQTIELIDSIKLPHDGAAVTFNDPLVYTVGQNAEGNSTLVAIEVSNNKAKIIHSKSVLSSASVITVNNNFVIVGGQGFEIFSM